MFCPFMTAYTIEHAKTIQPGQFEIQKDKMRYHLMITSVFAEKIFDRFNAVPGDNDLLCYILPFKGYSRKLDI